MDKAANEQLSLIPVTSLNSLRYEKEYYIMEFPYYATVVFYGTHQEAKEYFSRTKTREGRGTFRIADPDNKDDRDLVIAEIQAVREDKANGIKNLPFYPSKNWF